MFPTQSTLLVLAMIATACAEAHTQPVIVDRATLEPFPAADLIIDGSETWEVSPSYENDVASWCGDAPREWEITSAGLVSSTSLTAALVPLHERLDEVLSSFRGLVSVTMVFGQQGDVRAVRTRVQSSDGNPIPSDVTAAAARAACGVVLRPPPEGRYVVELRRRTPT